jgi:hypothetical protein
MHLSSLCLSACLLVSNSLVVASAQEQAPLTDAESQALYERAFDKSLLKRICLTPDYDERVDGEVSAPFEFPAQADCAYRFTNPSAEYAPGVIYEIPVVFHVIQNTSGVGFVSEAQVQSQIDVLNEDFRALPGTNGAPGLDSRIRFKLATLDPTGNPTTGVTYSMNNQWFNDGGQYWNTLAWAPDRYMNVYTNLSGGALGYTAGLASTANYAGTRRDRVVVLWSVVGKDAPYGLPWDQGRIATHEVGHYLGLWHTFDFGCGTANCYTTGDTLCDTSSQQSPTNGCVASATSCGTPDPVTNYMDYTDDACIWDFSEEQILRMRCSISQWRPQLATVIQPDPLVAALDSVSVSSGGSIDFELETSSPMESWFYWIFGSATGTAPGIDFGGGVLLPLEFDGYFNLLLTNPNAMPFQNFTGLLDHNGRAQATLVVPAGLDPSLAGVTLYHAYLAGVGPGTAGFASEAESLMLVP